MSKKVDKPTESGWWWWSGQDDPVKVLKASQPGKLIAYVNNSPGFNIWTNVEKLPKGWWEKMEKPK